MKASKKHNSAGSIFARSAIAAAIASTYFSGAAIAQDTTATSSTSDTKSEDTQLDEITVTGSRLSRAGLEGALPVTVITREQIDLSGDISVAEFLRDVSLNTFGSFRQQSGSSAQSLAAIDIRGLGSERTLVLIDGKRAPKAPFAPTAQDLNAIPLAAVERVEILQDGASAIYGSDAIAGVVNIILRKDFQGSQISYGRGFTDITNGDNKTASFILGLPATNGNVVMGASYNSRDIVFARDLIEAGIDGSGSSTFGNNYVTPDDGFASLNAVPGGCSASNAFFIANGTARNSTVDLNGDGVNDLCNYDFNRVAADEASAENMALFGKGRFAINSDWGVYSTASVSRSKSFGRYAPAPALLFVPASASGIDHGNDGDFDTVYVYHRFDALGNRDDTVDGQVYDILVGFDGNLDGAKIDFGGRYNQYKAFILGRNYVVNPIASQLATSGDYNFRDPLANDPTTLNQMKATIARESTWTARDFWGSVALDLFPLPGGAFGLAAGFDYYDAVYTDQYDSLSEGGVIGGSAGNSAGGVRDITGYYIEAAAPVLPNLDITAAVRADKYSDLSETELSPKLSVSFQPADMVKLRAAVGEGFRAPTLDVITQKPSFSAEPIVNDQQTCEANGGVFTDGECDTTMQVNTTIIANPGLKPEESRQYSFGVVVDPTDYLDVSLDWYSYEVDDLIAFISPSDLIDLQNQGESLPPGLSITRSPTQGNTITAVVAGYGNRGTLETSGLNLDTAVRLPIGPGRFKTNLQFAYVLGWELDTVGRDQVNDPGFPEYRANWNTSYGWGPVTAAWNQTYIAAQAKNVDSNGNQTGDTGDWWTHDIQVSYDMPFNVGMLTLGILNVTDEKPPVYEYDGRPYNFYLYNSYGLTQYFKYTLRFG